jgi:hypothetical protein
MASTTYTDRPTWAANAGTATTVNFSQFDDGTPLTSPPANVFFPSLTIAGATFLNVHSLNDVFIYVDALQTIHVNLPPGTVAAGADLGPMHASLATYTIRLSTGEVFNGASSGQSTPSDFFGFISSTPVQWVEYSIDSGATLTLGNFAFAKSAIIAASVVVRPGDPNKQVNTGSNMLVPVAVLSSSTFNPGTIDPSTVRFGLSGTEAQTQGYELYDVNGDGIPDLILHFRAPLTGIMCDSTSAKLTGKTQSGQQFAGSDSVTTLGCH